MQTSSGCMLLKHITCTLSCGIHSFTWVSTVCGSPSSRRIVPGLQRENKRGLRPNKYPRDIRCIWGLIVFRVPSQGTTIFPMKVWTPGWYYFLERERSAEKALPRPAYSAASHSQNQPAALVHHCTILCLPPSTPPDFHWQIPGTGMWHVHWPTNAWQIITQQNHHNRNTPQGVTNSRLWRHSIIIRVLSRVLIVTLTVCCICGCHLLQQMRKQLQRKGRHREYLFNIFSESFLSSVHNLFLSMLMNLTFTHSRVAPKLQFICKLPPTSELLVLPTKTMCSWNKSLKMTIHVHWLSLQQG